jgi:hypothetical protein
MCIHKTLPKEITKKGLENVYNDHRTIVIHQE